MNTQMKITGAAVAILLTAGLLTLPAPEVPPDKFAPPIVESLDTLPGHPVRTGRKVTLQVSKEALARPGKAKVAVHYQWRKDGVEIVGATNQSYEITYVTVTNVGSYTLVLTGGLEEESVPFHLAVYTLFENESNGGYLTIPHDSFITGSTLLCTPSGTSFDRYKVYFPFDGPNTTPPSANFPNTSNETNLIVNTCTNFNGSPLDTAVRVMENFGDMNLKCCNNNFACGTPNTKLSSCTATGLLSGMTYRVAIYYKKSTLGTNMHVTFRWKYSNGFTW